MNLQAAVLSFWVWLVSLQAPPESPSAPSSAVRHLVCRPPAGMLADGVWVSDELASGLAIREAWPSWEVVAPAGTGVQLALRFRTGASTAWGGWLTVGQWGDEAPAPEDEATQSAGVAIDVDTVLCSLPQAWVQWRVISRGRPDGVRPVVGRLVLAMAGNPLGGANLPPDPLVPPARPDWRGIVMVPYRDQGTDVPRMKGSLCSPTTTWMALASVGRAEGVLEDFASRVYDRRHDLFGVWPRATAAAAERGLSGYVTRLAGLDALRDHLAAGHLIGASVRYAEGQLKRPPALAATKGHLILLRGIRADGAVIANDPASAGSGDGFAWLPEDLATAWLDRSGGGMAYVFERAESLQGRP
ncbi:MAG: C39 family peptidase [Candidatus Sericytochromatia bacterium]|nr:C39 family peptidase [Candidatus Sericytochromatia bacterium]